MGTQSEPLIERNANFRVRLCYVPTGPVAVKFLHKPDYVYKNDLDHPKTKSNLNQLSSEFLLHQKIGRHKNIIEFKETGETPRFRWIALEYAEGGDLFDKIGIEDCC